MLQNYPSIYVGLDVHKESLSVAIASPERGGEVRFYGNIPNQQQSITYLFLKIKKQYPSVMACYEAGPYGYNIYHQLTAMNIECIVVAPSRIPDLTHEAMRDLVCQLQALKGVGKTIAISLASELGDFSRFPNPKQIMAYIGLIPREYSNGKKIRSLGITKTGNSELRRLLYEAAWAYRSSAKVGSWLITYRPAAATQESKDIVWKAQQRLCARYKTLLQKGKQSQIAVTAVARELTRFM